MKSKIIATDGKSNLWLIGDQIHKAPIGAILDADGSPIGARWECSFKLYQHFKDNVFKNFMEVKP